MQSRDVPDRGGSYHGVCMAVGFALDRATARGDDGDESGVAGPRGILRTPVTTSTTLSDAFEGSTLSGSIGCGRSSVVSGNRLANDHGAISGTAQLQGDW